MTIFPKHGEFVFRSLTRLAALSALIVTPFFVGCATQKSTPVEVVQVVQMGDLSTNDLYNRARQWFSEYFVSGESVVDYEDRDAGTIIGNGLGQIGTYAFGLGQEYIRYNLRIDVREGRIRVSTNILEHINRDHEMGSYTVEYLTEDRILLAEAHVNEIVRNLQTYIESHDAPANDNW